jgi:hypothetical protein
MTLKKYVKPMCTEENSTLDCIMNQGSSRPRNGYGDDNHKHHGPHPVKERNPFEPIDSLNIW